MPETIDDRFDKKFLNDNPFSLIQFKPEMQGRLPQEFKSFISEELDEIEKRIEAEKGNGKVTSGSPGPMFDWGCSQGYNLAIKAALAIIRERKGK